MKNVVLVSLAFVFLAGCSSTKLDETPVQDMRAAQGNASSGSRSSADGVSSGAAGQSPSASRRGGGNDNGITSVDADASRRASNEAGESPRTIYFDYDSFVISPEFEAVLQEQARYLKADRSRKAAIEGHTDERGGHEYNLSLGQKRAEAVRQALRLLGVSEAQLDTISFGKEKPFVQGHDESAHAKNRRAEIAYNPSANR